MKVGRWSIIPASNNSAPPDGWPEGQAPSTVNDCARELMASVRTLVSNLEYVDLDSSPTFLTSTSFSLGTIDSNFEVGRRLKMLDSTTLYGTIISASGTFVQVRLDNGFLSTSLSSVALAVVRNTNHSLPTHVYRNTNMITNGQMNVWQRGDTISSMVANSYMADRFTYAALSGAVVVGVRKNAAVSAANVPTFVQSGVLFQNSMQLTVTTGDNSLAVSEYATILHVVEGYDWQKIAHRPMNLSFWVNTNVTGIYTVAMRNESASVSYVQAFTVTAANSWTRFFMPIPKAPTTPYTWDYRNGGGLRVSWCLGSNSVFQANAGAWTAMNAVAVSTQVNWLATVGNNFMLTGVQLREGSVDAPPEILTYGEELQRCQRYYWRGLPTTDLNFPSYTVGSTMSWPIMFVTPMRTVPTVAITIPGATYTACQSATVGSVTSTGFRFLVFTNAESINANMHFVATDFFEADSEF